MAHSGLNSLRFSSLIKLKEVGEGGEGEKAAVVLRYHGDGEDDDGHGDYHNTSLWVVPFSRQQLMAGVPPWHIGPETGSFLGSATTMERQVLHRRILHHSNLMTIIWRHKNTNIIPDDPHATGGREMYVVVMCDWIVPSGLTVDTHYGQRNMAWQ